mmetsp:Transcript_112203/g.198752  ORF Transcript_112203/g.198752 Transcript_112203/m.198752 type:complete len:217 (+) Transcript_112203:76-726(+)
MLSIGASASCGRTATNSTTHGAAVAVGAAGQQDLLGYGQVTIAIDRASELLEKVSPSKAAPSSSQASYQERLDRVEENIHGFNRLLQEEQKPNPDEELLLRHISRMAEELEASRKSRQRLEERARYLDELLKKERGEREAWMVEFLSSMTTTLQDLAGAVNRSLEDNSKQVGGRMDETEAMIERLIGRVDRLMAPSGGSLRHGAPTTDTASLPPGG